MNKNSPAFSPKPLKLIKTKGTMITASDEKEKEITRDISQFKKIPGNTHAKRELD